MEFTDRVDTLLQDKYDDDSTEGIAGQADRDDLQPFERPFED